MPYLLRRSASGSPPVYEPSQVVSKIMTEIEVAPHSQSAPATAPSTDADITVYFDGSCPLCSLEIAQYASHRGADRLAFVDASDPQTCMGADLGRGDAMKRFHVRLADDRVLSGAAAFIEIWNALPGWRWAARIARLPGVVPVLEAAYRIFLPVRPQLSGFARRLGARAFRAKETGLSDG
jgi:predicted DCC family thiol-disulfide oxidoreductase YuxK